MHQEVLIWKYFGKHWSGNTSGSIVQEISQEALARKYVRKIRQETLVMKVLVKKYARKYCSGNTSGSIDLEIRREALVRKYVKYN